MWTEEHRARHKARLKELVCLRSIGEVARWLGRADPPRSGKRTPVRQVVAGLCWHLRVGGAWRALPSSFPPWRTVSGWFRRWLAMGLLEAMMRAVARLRRRAAGRRREPRLCIVDTQAVACIGVRGPRGYDAGKKVWGRKRVALVDGQGHWLAVAVMPASVQDRDTLAWLETGKACWPSLREGVYDGAFGAERCREWSTLHGMRHRVVERDPAIKGFAVIKRRWVVERSFGWLSHWNGLARDRAGRLDVSAARIALAAIFSGLDAVLNPMPVQKPQRYATQTGSESMLSLGSRL
jgi:putative transposase